MSVQSWIWKGMVLMNERQHFQAKGTEISVVASNTGRVYTLSSSGPQSSKEGCAC
jgi:hypothetical protein